MKVWGPKHSQGFLAFLFHLPHSTPFQPLSGCLCGLWSLSRSRKLTNMTPNDYGFRSCLEPWNISNCFEGSGDRRRASWKGDKNIREAPLDPTKKLVLVLHFPAAHQMSQGAHKSMRPLCPSLAPGLLTNLLLKGDCGAPSCRYGWPQNHVWICECKTTLGRRKVSRLVKLFKGKELRLHGRADALHAKDPLYGQWHSWWSHRLVQSSKCCPEVYFKQHIIIRALYRAWDQLKFKIYPKMPSWSRPLKKTIKLMKLY